MGEGARWATGLTISIAALIIAWLAWQHPKSPPGAIPENSDAPTVVATPSPTVRNLGYDQLQAGDCVTGSNLARILLVSNFTWPDSVEAVLCTQPHVAEVYFANDSYWKQAASYPGNDSVDSTGNAVCGSKFNSYVGISYNNSLYSYAYIDPSSASWAGGDRSMLCVAYYEVSGKPGAVVLNKSLRGAHKLRQQ